MASGCGLTMWRSWRSGAHKLQSTSAQIFAFAPALRRWQATSRRECRSASASIPSPSTTTRMPCANSVSRTWVLSPHDTDAPLTTKLLFEGWHRNGFLAVNGSSDYGVIALGAPADIVVLDYDQLSYDVVDGMIDPLELVLTRATARHVKSLYVAGREIVRDGRVLGVDLPAIEREVIAQARRHAERMRGLKPVLERSQATLKRFYVGGGHRGDRRIS